MYVFIAVDPTADFSNRLRNFVHRAYCTDDTNALDYAEQQRERWTTMYNVPYNVVVYSPDAACVGQVTLPLVA